MSLRIGEAVASAYSFVVTQVIFGFVKEKYFKSLRLESAREESARFLTYHYVLCLCLCEKHGSGNS